MSKAHPTFPKFTEVGSVDVDAGCVWIGDPCYVLKDKGEARPTDLGKDWHDICNRFFDRSGYTARSHEWTEYCHHMDQATFESPEWSAFYATRPKGEPSREWRDELSKIKKAFRDKYMAENPFTPKNPDKGVASFKHDLGHEGMGVMISTFYGDGGYPVYIEYGEGGRPRRVLIDFDPGGDEEAEELDVAA